MVNCLFCGSTVALWSPPNSKNWICKSCMGHLARELHGEEDLGVKKVEAALKKHEGRNNDRHNSRGGA